MIQIHFQCSVIWKPISQFNSINTQNRETYRRKKTAMRGRLLNEHVQNVVMIKCLMLHCSWEVLMKVKLFSTHVPIASKWRRQNWEGNTSITNPARNVYLIKSYVCISDSKKQKTHKRILKKRHRRSAKLHGAPSIFFVHL